MSSSYAKFWPNDVPTTTHYSYILRICLRSQVLRSQVCSCSPFRTPSELRFGPRSADPDETDPPENEPGLFTRVLLPGVHAQAFEEGLRQPSADQQRPHRRVQQASEQPPAAPSAAQGPLTRRGLVCFREARKLPRGPGLLKRYISQPFETWLFPPK